MREQRMTASQWAEQYSTDFGGPRFYIMILVMIAFGGAIGYVARGFVPGAGPEAVEVAHPNQPDQVLVDDIIRINEGNGVPSGASNFLVAVVFEWWIDEGEGPSCGQAVGVREPGGDGIQYVLLGTYSSCEGVLYE